MKEYFVRFHQEFEYNCVKYEKDEVIYCVENEAWRWVEISKEENIKLAIYEAEMVCDLS